LIGKPGDHGLCGRNLQAGPETSPRIVLWGDSENTDTALQQNETILPQTLSIFKECSKILLDQTVADLEWISTHAPTISEFGVEAKPMYCTTANKRNITGTERR
jgi:hypothetical protein